MKRFTSIAKRFIFLLFNIIFWIGVYFFYTYFLGYGSSNTAYVDTFSAYLMPITIFLSYFIILYLIPNYLLKKKYFLFILYSSYTFIISFTAILLSIFFGLVFSSFLEGTNTKTLTKSLPLVIIGVYFIVIVATSLSLIIYNYLSNIKNENLKNKFLQTQLQLKEQKLKFLKMQIHPHFLFNTLNTLYGFALKKSEEAPDMILKLSNLLDYILYQVDKPSVLLKNEIQHIDDYISLEKTRFQESLHVNFTKSQHNETTQIPPMLLLPFVENAFKHGVQIDGILSVDINLKTTEDSLFFHIKNTSIDNKVNKNGIGLENIQKRLKMLYGHLSKLSISSIENQFIVELKIPLKNGC
ncbi:sensor histidine kinase [Tenacibaculum singaporense]|uniref:Histidine kinase n=1 Tax=Tenacibaculum singaporense TaxID=2358479 RepID=A0A3Q8RQV3_9FLAO|nr:histidine kinase [Tenacibaculum singaporense]AZJ34963.1 histidine kinase [Tenacibaculum singaporense]